MTGENVLRLMRPMIGRHYSLGFGPICFDTDRRKTTEMQPSGSLALIFVNFQPQGYRVLNRVTVEMLIDDCQMFNSPFVVAQLGRDDFDVCSVQFPRAVLVRRGQTVRVTAQLIDEPRPWAWWRLPVWAWRRLRASWSDRRRAPAIYIAAQGIMAVEEAAAE